MAEMPPVIIKIKWSCLKGHEHDTPEEALTCIKTVDPESETAQLLNSLDKDKAIIAALIFQRTAWERADVISRLEKENFEFGKLLREWLEEGGYNSECELDHHGYCQAHFMQRDCMVKRTRDILK